MAQYHAPLKDMKFILEEMSDLRNIERLPGCEEVTSELAWAILHEADRFASGVLAPLNAIGDRQGCRWSDTGVTTAPGWADAYLRFQQAGWVGLSLPKEFGGQGLPKLIATAVWEMWFSANMAFAMAPQLNNGQAAALLLAASEEIKATYLPKVVSGQWAGTMNLTEPQAGSDLAATRMRAETHPDGSYRLFGQKIFISYGDHDLTENIIHLVLARLPDAPPGVKGISLFVVPKRLINADGSLGARNDVRCIAIEHKMGIHGSPTCTMSYGEGGGAVGFLVGEPNRGLEYMFIMMNDARFGVGVQGFALGEIAYQHALAYARERVQGRDAVTGISNVPIICHPDVKRMLLAMRSRVMAPRMLAYAAAGWHDQLHYNPDRSVANKCGRYLDLLMPVIKGWSTELGNEAADIAIQVFGGSGYVEETGVAQVRRDARIITIYEGTTGIQANDLIGRKLLREGGETLKMLLGEMRDSANELLSDPEVRSLGASLNTDLDILENTTRWILVNGREHLAEVLAGAVPFLHLLGTVCGSWQMGQAALAARKKLAVSDEAYYRGIIDLARFWFTHNATQVPSLGRIVCEGGTALANFDPEALFSSAS